MTYWTTVDDSLGSLGKTSLLQALHYIRYSFPLLLLLPNGTNYSFKLVYKHDRPLARQSRDSLSLTSPSFIVRFSQEMAENRDRQELWGQASCDTSSFIQRGDGWAI